MDSLTAAGGTPKLACPGRLEDELAAARHGVVARLADPYLTEHDRWVLGQFERFLAGVTPSPDPRAGRDGARATRPLHQSTRWTRV
jgi:hypothetical protein